MIVPEIVDVPDLDAVIFLKKWNKFRAKLTKKKLDCMILDMVRAVGYIHGQDTPIIHQDIKPGNFLVDEHNLQVKLADLGIGRHKMFNY